VDHAPVLRNLSMRAGFGATGAIYLALGIVSARVALLGTRRKEAGIPGALRFLLAQPYGDFLLGAVVAGLAAIAVVHFGEAAGGKRGRLFRLGLAVNGFGYATLAWAAGRLLFHVEKGSGSLRKTGVPWLLGESWGPAVLGFVGLVVAGGGVWEAWQGVRGRLPFRKDLLPRRLVKILAGIARFGLIARGIVLCALGYFLCRAAIEGDASRVQSMGGALRTFSQATFGPALMGTIAFGLAAYGVYLWTLMLLKRRV
jgi:hypothetical protein